MGINTKLNFLSINSLKSHELKLIEKKFSNYSNLKDLKKLKEACFDFEAIFIEKLWNEMKKTLPKGGIFEDKILENYLSIFDMEFARSLAKKGGIGLGKMLYNNLKKILEQKSKFTESEISARSFNLRPMGSDLERTKKDKIINEIPFKEFLKRVKHIHEVESLAKKIKTQKMQENKLYESQNGHKGEDLKDLDILFNENHFVMPVKGKITSHFGWRMDPILHKLMWHNGVDISAPVGTPVKAALDGKVVFAGKSKGYGKLVILKHKNGLRTFYAHLSKILVREGERVDSGDVIGKVGTTGRSTGPHLHFEVRFKDRSLDPERLSKEFASLEINVWT